MPLSRAVSGRAQQVLIQRHVILVPRACLVASSTQCQLPHARAKLSNSLMNVAVMQVLEAAVIGLPHPKWGERPLLVIVPNPGQKPSKDAILAHLQVCCSPASPPASGLFPEHAGARTCMQPP